jgi:hypothetical protein
MTSTTDAPLMWAPPTMNNPTIIDLSKTGGQTWWNFAPDQDVIFIGDSQNVRTDKIQTQGGHNIEVLGGDYQPTTAPTGTFAFYGVNGTAFVDGVHIDNSKSSGTDGIDISGGANTSLVVQNSSIVNVNGAYSGGQAAGGNGHADGIQTQGNIGGEVHIHNMHITTNYQGIFIAPQYQINPSQVVLDNVDLHYTAGTANDGSQTSYLLWTNDNPATEQHVPWSFNNVYVDPRPGQQAIESAVWPKAEGGAVQNGDQISWPNLPYKGSVTVGNHADFTDASKIGLNFHDAQTLVSAATGGSTATTQPAPASPPTSSESAPTPAPTSTSSGSTPAPAPAPAPASASSDGTPAPTPATTSSGSTPAPTPAQAPSDGHTGSGTTDLYALFHDIDAAVHTLFAAQPAQQPQLAFELVQMEQALTKLVEQHYTAPPATTNGAAYVADAHHVQATADHWHVA